MGVGYVTVRVGGRVRWKPGWGDAINEGRDDDEKVSAAEYMSRGYMKWEDGAPWGHKAELKAFAEIFNVNVIVWLDGLGPPIHVDRVYDTQSSIEVHVLHAINERHFKLLMESSGDATSQVRVVTNMSMAE